MADFGFWAVLCGVIVGLAALFQRALLRPVAVQAPGAADLQVYRDQLTELDRDIARGTVGAEDGARMRVEIARRLLDADRSARAGAAAAAALPLPLAGLLVMALLATGLASYWWLGAPGYRDLPLAQRLADAETLYRSRPSQAEAEAQAPAPDPASLPKPDAAFLDLMDKLRAALKANPDDPTGLQLLAENEASLGNMAAAARAQAHLVEVKGTTATAQDRMMAAEYLILAAGGYVSPEAEAQLTAVLQADPRHALARYYAGLMFAQVGRPDRTFELWEPLLREGPADAPWIAPIRQGLPEIAAMAGVRYALPDAKGPTADDVEAAAGMSAGDRQAMIEGMVGNLEARLLAEGGPEEDWLKLLNALRVLNQPDRLAAARKAAEAAFAADPAALDRLRAAGEAP